MRLLPSIAASLLAVTLTGCFNEESVEIYTITTNAGEGGLISPPVTQAETGEVVRFYIEPDENAIINEVTGCDGTLNGNLYFTPPMSQDCEITATFLSTVVDLPDREVFPEIDATIAVAPDANYGFVPGSVRFTPTTGGAANLPAPLPENINPSSSLLEYSVKLETPGDTATITITYDEPIGLGDRPMKFGPESAGAEPTWYYLPFEMFTYGDDGLSIELTITDGELGDSDGERNGIIEDPLVFTKVGEGVTIIQTDDVGEGFFDVHNSSLVETNTGNDINLVVAYSPSYFERCDVICPTAQILESMYFTVGCAIAKSGENSLAMWVSTVAYFSLNYNENSTSCTILLNHPHKYQVSTERVGGITFAPRSLEVHRNLGAEFSISIPQGVLVEGITGCDGATLNESKTVVSVPHVLEHCTLTPVLGSYTVTAQVEGAGGTITPPARDVQPGNTTSFELTPEQNFEIGAVSGCGGSLSGNTYRTGPINADCQVTASFNEMPYMVSTSAGEGGTISPTSRDVRTNETVAFTISPQTGYQIDTVSGCPGALAGFVYTAGPITGNCTVSATFSLQSITVTASAGAGGRITPSSRVVDYGSTTTFTVSPYGGYQVDNVTGCGGQFNSTTNTFTTGTITEVCHVSANFETAIYNLTGVRRGAGSGSVIPSSPTVEHGQSASFTITPEENSTIGKITAQGCSGELSGNTYSIASVENNCSVAVEFDLITYVVSLNQTGSGQVQNSLGTDFPADVVFGNNLYVVAVPDNGLTLGSIQGCSVTLSDITDPSVDADIYSTEPIVADCTIDVVFEAIEYQVSAIVTNTAGGSVSAASSTVLHGQDVSFNVTPNDGYLLSAPTISEGCGQLKSDINANPIVIGPVTADNCAYEFAFEIKQYTVNFNRVGEGVITDIFSQPMPDSIQVNHGQTVGLFAAAATGYNLASAEGCGGFTQNPVQEIIGLVSAPVVADCTVQIVFELKQYQITTSADNGGSWSPESATFTHGQEEAIEFTLTVPSDYEVNSVTGCDYTDSGNVYAVSGITADCSLDATLKLQIDAPTNLSTQAGDGMVTIYFDSVADADSYQVYYAKESITNVENYASLDGGGVTTFPSSIGTVIGTVQGLDNDVEYFFKVTTVQGAFESDGSAQVSATPVSAGASAGGLNDTGATNCASAMSANVSCLNFMVPDQDAEHGRDADLANSNLTKEGDGAGSLDLTKLNAGGVALTVQDQAWDNGGNEVVGTQWSCVQDNVTGLVWDSRVNDVTNYRHKENFYTWYNSTPTENGGDAGLEEDTMAVPPFACVDGICNTESYVAELNASAHCGFTDWRLPTMPEMYDLFGSEHRVDADYFPHIVPMTPYWTANTLSQSVAEVFCMMPGVQPSVSACLKSDVGLVMPVRAD
ncbi:MULTISPECIES: DUF1566 domain-containing protein [Gammaproteobacteria]|uniref:DUF1566 domain-containing protein n=1 Tax=Gammaproteobacteria TaxID=1236 RepID=UPI000DCF7168|nr:MULTISPECIES: DUF1566 domain-containing protein [Gammaproteobacteria]RTE87764.1 DUF1566 domain-containing protein [Aliidiomarina sp. B3213]TCZ92454.1 DUF1566 domain-containing protein [Lysobacter sp. N42]